MKSIDEDNLHSTLASAFDSLDPPVNLSGRDNEDYIDKEDVEYFRGRDRWTLPSESLVAGSYALNNFTTETFKYYLPGLLLLVAKKNFSNSLLLDKIIGGADGTFFGIWRKLSEMNKKQSEAFLLWADLLEREQPERKWTVEQIRRRLSECWSSE